MGWRIDRCSRWCWWFGVIEGSSGFLERGDCCCGAVACVLAAIDFRYSGYVNTAKTHRYHLRFVRDIFGALRRSIRYRF
jgi:hypothetical protein